MSDAAPQTRVGLERPEAAGQPGSLVLTPLAFWAIFMTAWTGFGFLVCSTIVMQGEGARTALIGGVALVVPLAAPSVAIALLRRTFLQPRRSLVRFIGHKALVGIAYGATVALLGGLVLWLSPLEPMTEFGDDPRIVLGGWGLQGIFMYTILLVFLMWSDALERAHESRTLAAHEASLRAQAEAKALRARFNPHFVFNTLHSLMLLVRRDPDTAERAIEDVAALIRYASTLERREVDQVPLSKELAFARRYIALEKLRLAERLRVEWDVDGSLEDVLVPAFSLQTLLENSIKHGISPKSEGGAVRIRVVAEDGRLALTVEDDGVGADPATVARNGGSGLELLGQRLRTVYDGAATLEWATADGEGFRATVRVPVRRVQIAEAAPA